MTAFIAPPTDTAETYGWDTVFATHIADANAAIVKAGSSPSSFAASDVADGYSVSGGFGPWQIVTGGSGDLIRLSIPFQNAVVRGPGNVSQTCAGAALVDVRLAYLDHDEAPPSGTSKVLKVQAQSSGPDYPAASVVSVSYAGTAPGFLFQAALEGMLGSWLNENLQDFDHVFATVNLDRTADQGAFQWMQPTYVGYAYADMGTPGDGLLSVLCMTQGRADTGLAQQVSGLVIPSGQRAGFLVSKERLLANLLLPCMPQVFQGTVASDFVLSASGDAIVNASGSIGFQVTTPASNGHAAATYHAQIVNLQLTVEAQELQMSVTTVTEVSPGIQAYCQTQNFLGIRLVNKQDGTQTLGFFDSRPAVKTHWTQASPGIEITEEILGIVALLLAAVAVVVSGGAAIGAVALIVGLVAGVMTLTTTIIESVGNNDAPSIDALVLDSTASITWPDSKDFQLGNACLNDSLQLGGTLSAAVSQRASMAVVTQAAV
ncbi:TULIP family P47-like protein [Cupriavidus oxalaticus]|uniref:TULIP family P47-like protein n=1 Tax=Cupriavidus oxalaticus TaxID=96344 RepID=UPI00317FB156